MQADTALIPDGWTLLMMQADTALMGGPSDDAG